MIPSSTSPAPRGRLLIGLALLTLVTLPLARAAGAPAAAAPAHAPAAAVASPVVAAALPQAGRVYVVMPGDTLDRVVQKTMAGSPLKNEFLREALVAANPQAIPAGRQPRLTPGTVLQVPAHEDVLRKVLLPLLPAVETASAPGPVEGDTRRRWVRFP